MKIGINNIFPEQKLKASVQPTQKYITPAHHTAITFATTHNMCY